MSFLTFDLTWLAFVQASAGCLQVLTLRTNFMESCEHLTLCFLAPIPRWLSGGKHSFRDVKVNESDRKSKDVESNKMHQGGMVQCGAEGVTPFEQCLCVMCEFRTDLTLSPFRERFQGCLCELAIVPLSHRPTPGEYCVIADPEAGALEPLESRDPGVAK